jgi:hypothetical protein
MLSTVLSSFLLAFLKPCMNQGTVILFYSEEIEAQRLSK